MRLVAVAFALSIAITAHADSFSGAQWIGYNPKPPRRTVNTGAESRLNWEAMNWIWTGETDADGNALDGQRLFRWRVNLERPVRSAWYRVAADNEAAVSINGKIIAREILWPSPTEREVTEFLRDAENVLHFKVRNFGATPAGITAKLVVEYPDGEIQEFVPEQSSMQWQVAPSQNDDAWAKPDPGSQEWKSVVVLGELGMAPWGNPEAGYYPGSLQPAPAPLLRKTFSVRKGLTKATLLSSGLGCHEIQLNGSKVGDSVLDPAMTQYDKTVLYVENEVSAQLHAGTNAIGVMLGHGWYAHTARTTWNFDRASWHDRPKALVALKLTYQDGSTETVVSDGSWKAELGPVIADDFMTGEVYDAREEKLGWSSSEFDDASWKPVEIMNAPAGALTPQDLAPMRVTRTMTPINVTETAKGVWCFDLGQNIAGWARIRVKGKAGDVIKLRFSEGLRNNRVDRILGGLIWSGWYQADRYILKGQGVEEWEPRFTYHGFRYVEVEGLRGKPTLMDLDGRFVHTDFNSAGSFACSDSLINQIQSAILQGYCGNFHGFPTDCPTREKKGWTGDAHLACEQAMFNWQNAAGYHKWMRDFADVQDAQGRLRTVIPTPEWGGEACDWNVAAVMIPWYVYLYTGNLDIVRSAYPMMEKWCGYYLSQKSRIIDNGVSDWCPAKSVTPRALTSTAYFYGALQRMAAMAKALEKNEEAKRYEAEAASYKEAFNKEFVKPDGTVGSGNQTSQACALYFKLLPESLRVAAGKKLSEAVSAAGDHVDVGILGSKVLFRALSDAGYHEQAWQVLKQRTAPGYGAMLAKEPSTLSENWYGGGTQNHIMFGDISAWFYSYLAGIRADAEHPGFKHFVIRPMPVGDLEWVRAEHQSPYGLIRVEWRRKGAGSYQAQIRVPAGSTATLALPGEAVREITAGDHVVDF